MKNKNEYIKEFVMCGMCEGMSSNLYTIFDGHGCNALINYKTKIAIYDMINNKIILNSDYYSSTTSRNQNLIKKLAKQEGIDILEVDEEGIYNYNR